MLLLYYVCICILVFNISINIVNVGICSCIIFRKDYVLFYINLNYIVLGVVELFKICGVYIFWI